MIKDKDYHEHDEVIPHGTKRLNESFKQSDIDGFNEFIKRERLERGISEDNK